MRDSRPKSRRAQEEHRVSFDDLSKLCLDGRVHVQLVVLDAVNPKNPNPNRNSNPNPNPNPKTLALTLTLRWAHTSAVGVAERCLLPNVRGDKILPEIILIGTLVRPQISPCGAGVLGLDLRARTELGTLRCPRRQLTPPPTRWTAACN